MHGMQVVCGSHAYIPQGGPFRSSRPSVACSEVEELQVEEAQVGRGTGLDHGQKERKAVYVQPKVGSSPLLDCGRLALACCGRLALACCGRLALAGRRPLPGEEAWLRAVSPYCEACSLLDCLRKAALENGALVLAKVYSYFAFSMKDLSAQGWPSPFETSFSALINFL